MTQRKSTSEWLKKSFGMALWLWQDLKMVIHARTPSNVDELKNKKRVGQNSSTVFIVRGDFNNLFTGVLINRSLFITQWHQEGGDYFFTALFIHRYKNVHF